MILEEFRSSLTGDLPPAGVSPLLAALWWAARGDWEKAHTIAQDVESPDGARVHAYLHRREGDQANAGYWYRRAGMTPSRSPLDVEWEEIVRALLKA
jgi:hypothetical protein